MSVQPTVCVLGKGKKGLMPGPPDGAERWLCAASEELGSEPEKNNRNQGEDRRYQPGDHPKAVWAAAKRNAADVHAPNAAISVAGRNITENIVSM